MWLKCITYLSLLAVAQLLLLADALDDFHEVPNFQADWVLVFMPTILFLAFACAVVLSRFWRAAYYTSKARDLVNNKNAGDMADPKFSTVAGRAQAVLVYKRIAWVTFVDTVFDVFLLAAGIVFVVLVIDDLSTAQLNLLPAAPPPANASDTELVGEAEDTAVRAFNFRTASLPLTAIWALLTLAALSGAVRTLRAYNRAVSEGTVSDAGYCCCGSGDAGDGDDDNDASISYRAAGSVKENGTYMATAHYQKWPCAFMFTWSLGYGWPESVLSVLLFLMLPAMILVTTLFANFLDTGTPSITSIFIVLWILEALIIAFAILSLVWMAGCAYLPVNPVRGRSASLPVKAAELLVTLFVVVLLAVQQIMLAVRIDDEDPFAWNLVFVPSYVLFGLLTFADCMNGMCCARGTAAGSKQKSASSCNDDYDCPESGQPPQTSAWGLTD